jgi:hypothetical protein
MDIILTSRIGRLSVLSKEKDQYNRGRLSLPYCIICPGDRFVWPIGVLFGSVAGIPAFENTAKGSLRHYWDV